MDPKRLLSTAIIPALAELAAHGIKDSPAARRFMLAIALQESGLQHRRQVVAGGQELGPAVSYWMFERAGGCVGVLNHYSSSKPMRAICEAYDVQQDNVGLWLAMQYNDIVAAAAARLLIYTLPAALPATAGDGWVQYLRAWRPGKPHHDRWPANWEAASKAVGVV